MNAYTDVYRPPCPSCGRPMEVLFTTARCYRASCKRLADGFKRPTRVVGRIPDMWHGAGAKLRQYEGRSVVMVLNPEEIPLTSSVYRWISIEHCSAGDFDFSTKAVQQRIEQAIREYARWRIGPPIDTKESAEDNLRSDEVLLLVR